jgi:hypothetical protein
MTFCVVVVVALGCAGNAQRLLSPASYNCRVHVVQGGKLILGESICQIYGPHLVHTLRYMVYGCHRL